MLRRKGLAAVLVPAAALVLSGCGQSGQSPGTSGTSTAQTSATLPGLSAAHNEADVIFATDMIPHHAQAIEMADLALARPTSAQVRDLATRIKAAQDSRPGWTGECALLSSEQAGASAVAGTRCIPPP